MKKIITITLTAASMLILANSVFAVEYVPITAPDINKPNQSVSNPTNNNDINAPAMDISQPAIIPTDSSGILTPIEYDYGAPAGSVTNTGSVTDKEPPTVPKSTLDYSGWVKCDGVEVKDGSEPGRQNRCSFENLINMANDLINWAFMISIPVIVGLCAYAGFLFMTGIPANRSKANKMLWSAVKGFVIMLLAWFIVTTLLKWLVKDSFIQSASTLVGQTK